MPLQISEKSFGKILIALAVYITSLVGANTLGIKIMPLVINPAWIGLGFLPVINSHLSVGVFMFPVVFLMTDVIGEVYGKKIAKYFVFAGIISTLLFILYNVISIIAPWSSDPRLAWALHSYGDIFGVSLRFSIASVIAYAVGEYQDVISFFFFKRKLGDKSGFWIRSNLSNLWSQFFDTVLFMTIALYGVYPNSILFSSIITWWLFKVLMGLVYTPLAYVGIWLLKDNGNKSDQNQTV